jgi:hypothetical protein
VQAGVVAHNGCTLEGLPDPALEQTPNERLRSRIPDAADVGRETRVDLLPILTRDVLQIRGPSKAIPNA